MLNGDFSLINETQVVNTPADYTFSGIACYHPQVFHEQKIGRYSVASLMRAYVKEGKVTGELYQGTWFDIGSLERLRAAG